MNNKKLEKRKNKSKRKFKNTYKIDEHLIVLIKEVRKGVNIKNKKRIINTYREKFKIIII